MRTILFFAGLFGAVVAIQTLAAPSAYSEPEEKSRPERGRGDKHPGGPPKEHGALGPEFVERLTEHLKLSEEQQKKVKSIVEQARPEMEKMQQEMKAAAAKMKAAMRKTSEAIRETLDLDQKERFDEMSARMRQKMDHRRRGDMGERRERRVIEKREGPGGRFEAPDRGEGAGPPDEDKDD